jgi:hypothetical protein
MGQKEAETPAQQGHRVIDQAEGQNGIMLNFWHF